jgi:hypothetical protein
MLVMRHLVVLSVATGNALAVHKSSVGSAKDVWYDKRHKARETSHTQGL